MCKRKTKQVVGVFLLGLVLMSFLSCKKDKKTDWGTAHIRFINTAASSNPQDFYQEDIKITQTPVGYGEYSNYLGIAGGYSVLWTNDAVVNKATATADAIFYDQYKYTLFCYENSESKYRLVAYINETKTPSVGKFRVRFLNICTFFNDNKPLILKDKSGLGINSGLNFGDNPVYVELQPGNEIIINVEDEGLYTTIPANTFQEGKTYLVWFDTSDGYTVNYHIVPQE